MVHAWLSTVVALQIRVGLAFSLERVGAPTGPNADELARLIHGGGAKRAEQAVELEI